MTSDVTQDPNLFTSSLDGVHSVRVGYSVSSRKLIDIVVPHRQDEIRRFADLRELFKFAFPTRKVVHTDGASTKYEVDRLANMIAARTRRGCGNVIVHAPQTEFDLSALDGTQDGSYEFFTCRGLRPTEIAVLYRGALVSQKHGVAFDGPFYASLQDDGTVEAVITMPRKDAMADHDDYGQIIALDD